MISVIILTFNEEQNIAACLDSVKWSDDVLVLDSFSTDRTVEIARASGARVLQNRFTNFAEQRNFGLAHGGFKHDWILHLDADEIVTQELRDEVRAAVQDSKRDAYQVASKMMFNGHWLRYAGLYPSYQVRFGRREKLRFVQVGHGQREQMSAGKIGTLKSSLVHNSFSKGIHDWLEKHNRYSLAEALDLMQKEKGEALDIAGVFTVSDPVRRRRALKRLSFRLPCRPALRFIYMYFFRLGFLDGRAGVTYCRLLSMYEYMINLKVDELRRQARGLAM
jgi:glycosyltransferase involved in cell wall biosynthesis